MVIREQSSHDPFGEWAKHKGQAGYRKVINGARPAGDGLRFAFYGRTSTTGHQDRRTSYGWQREAADSLIAGEGAIVADYFDAGCSREAPWSRRPQAAALLQALTDRTFDAIVVGEYERAFSGNQFATLAPLLDAHGIRLWLPEAFGPVDMNEPAHRALMMMLGAQSRREVLRARHRVLAAMRVQVCEQGRYLGGRPPYGYRLVDAGPHPNQVHAQWGRRLRRLDPDPLTAPHVRWIFARRLSGVSVAGIARELNDHDVPCPSRVDRKRNPHRSGQGWTLNTVATILGNPRYTGRQVWYRQARFDDTTTGWVISKKPAHPALVSDADFVAAQTIRAARPTRDGSVRVYLLAGMLLCGLCRRRMDSHWVNGRSGYRCRHGYNSTKPRSRDAPKNLYLREDHLLDELMRQLSSRLGEARSPHELVAHLKRNGLAIVCHGSSCTVVSSNEKEPAPGVTSQIELFTSPMR